MLFAADLLCGIDNTPHDIIKQAQNADPLPFPQSGGPSQRFEEMQRQKTVTEFRALPSTLCGTRSGQNHAAFATNLIKFAVDRLHVSRYTFDMEGLSSHPARKTAVQYDQKASRGDAGAPFAKSRQRNRRSCEVTWISVKSDEFMRLGPMTRKTLQQQHRRHCRPPVVQTVLQ